MVGSNGSEKDIVGVDQMIQEQHATGEAETGEVDKKVAVKLKSLLSLQQDKDGPAEPVISVPSYPATSMYILAEKETVRSIFLGGGGSTQLIYKGERESYNTLVSSLFCFGPLNPLRIFAFDFINSKLAENATLLLIILNSITLSIDAADFNDEGLKGFLVASEYFFQIAFTIEMLTKILALGFMLHPHSYMRGTWNIIDFVVVMAGFSMFFPGGTNVSVVRLVRVIRPLRTISRVAGMRIIMNSIISSIPTLLEVFVLLSFLIIIFAITGMSLFGSNWHQRCHVVDETNDKLYYPVQNDSIPCGTGRNCSSNGVTLQQICVKGAYRDRILNFDHFLSATLLVIKIITLDDWPDDMRKAQNIAGFYSFAYFLILTIVGSYFCINLVLAILSSVFSEEADAQVMDAVQMSSVVFKEGDCLLSLSNATATNPGGQNPPDGDPSNVLDPNTDTKWTDYNLCELIVSFSSLVTVEAYSWVTAKDAPQCDPVSWRLSGSKDGLSWDHLDEVSDYPTTVERREELPPFTIERPEEYRAYKFTLLKRRIDIEDGELESEEELPTVEVNMNETVNSLDSAARLPWQRVPRRRKSKVKLSIQSTRSSFDEELEESETTLNNIRMRFVHIVCHPMFGWFILFVTIVNVTCMAMDHHGIDKSWKEITDQIIFWCSVVFVAEMFFKIFALGFKRYFQDRYNAFDCILVLISIPELVLAFKDGISGTGVSGSISAFRVFRLARFARVAERLEALRVLLETIVESILSVMYLFLIMLLFIFMFGILGLQLFKNTYPEAPQRYPEDYTAGERSHFDTFPQALLTVFVVITGEAWATVMRDGILGTSWGAALYFVLVFVFGNYVLLNLFIAILIYNFSEASKRSNLEAEDPSEAFAGTPRSVGHAARLLLCDSPRCSREIPNPLNRPASRERGREAIEYSIMWSNPRPENIIAEWLYTKLEEGRQEYRLQGMSFGFFPPDHRLRVFLAGIVLHPFFDYVVIFIILCNVVFLSLDNPSSDENRTRRDLIYITDIIFTVLFFLESVSKCIVLGVYHRVDDEDAEYGNYRTGYLNNVWNRIDMVVVVTAIAGLGFAPFKLFRSLRAVRLVIISVDVRVLVLSLLMALPQIAYVLLVCSFVWLVFGILGVSLFKGSFYYCTDLSVVAKEHCTGLHELVVLGWNGTETILEERQWKRPRYHFDNVGHAMMTLFEVAVGEGWAKIMYTGMDSSLDGDKALRKEANFVHSLYFVMFVIVGGFFAMNLFVGMLIDQFGRVRSEKDGTAFLSEPQRVWLGVAKVMSRTKLYRVPVVQYLNPVLHKISIIARHPYFDHFILGLIVVNLVFMCTAHEGQPVVVTDMLYYVYE